MDQIKELEAQIADIKNQIGAMDRGEQDAGPRPGLVDQLNIMTNQLAELTFNQEQQVEQAGIEKTQADHSGGLKEVIFQVFDSVLPKDSASKLLGLTEYDELAQAFRQAIDLAVDESNSALFTVIGDQLEAKDTKIRELTTQTITLDSQLQDSTRKEQAAQADIAERDDQLKAKDEQIAKLTEELNAAPQSNDIVAPEAKPSQSLEELLQKNATKSMTNFERILAGLAPQRGPVTIGGETTTTPEWQAIVPTFTPPTIGGSEDNNTFQGQDPTAISQGSGLDIPQVAGDSFQPPTVPDTDNTDSGNTALSTMVGETITERLAALEVAVFGKAKGKAEVAA